MAFKEDERSIIMKVRKAVFPVAGSGTRFLPAAKAIPKAMFPIIDKPIIHYAVEEAVDSGIEEIIFIITKNNQTIRNYFNPSIELERLLERQNKTDLLKQVQEIHNLAHFYYIPAAPIGKLQGLGIAVLNAKTIVGDEPFAVFLPNDLIDDEIPCTKNLVYIYEKLESPVLAVHRVPEMEISTYGNIGFCELDKESFQNLQGGPCKCERIYEVKKLIQKPDPKKREHLSNMAIIGRYILPSEIFSYLEKIPPGHEEQVQLTDALEALRKSGQKIYAYEFEGQYYDTRSKSGYINASLNFALKQPDLAKSIYDLLNLINR
jgi:UTP--glucose-1-phosphate uridylyltransferase